MGPFSGLWDALAVRPVSFDHLSPVSEAEPAPVVKNPLARLCQATTSLRDHSVDCASSLCHWCQLPRQRHHIHLHSPADTCHRISPSRDSNLCSTWFAINSPARRSHLAVTIAKSQSTCQFAFKQNERFTPNRHHTSHFQLHHHHCRQHHHNHYHDRHNNNNNNNNNVIIIIATTTTTTTTTTNTTTSASSSSSSQAHHQTSSPQPLQPLCSHLTLRFPITDSL
jgi:hypothetical protein